METGRYFVRWRGWTTGPFDLERLKGMVEQGRLSKLHDISSDETEWTRAGSLAELFPPYECEPRALAQTIPEASAEPAYAATEQRSEEGQQEAPEWYYSSGHNVEGPCSGAVIRQLIADGTLSPDDYVNSSSDPWMWKPIRGAAEFADAVRSVESEAADAWSLHSAAEPAEQRPDLSALAAASLILGMLGVFVPLSGIAALICARKARRRMRQTGNYRGSGLSSAGVVLGIIDVGLDIVRIGLAAVFLVRHFGG